jgi:hypothetical protein
MWTGAGPAFREMAQATNFKIFLEEKAKYRLHKKVMKKCNNYS